MHPLTQSENTILAQFAAHEHYRGTAFSEDWGDGVADPDTFLRQQIKIVFVLREPHIDLGTAFRGRHSILGNPWWVSRMSPYGRAALAGLEADPAHESAVAESRDPLRQLCFLQLRKTGGGATSVTDQLRAAAVGTSALLARQIDLYQPDLIVGTGLGAGSPARLLRDVVFPGRYGHEQRTEEGLSYWRAAEGSATLLEMFHPSARISRERKERTLRTAVRELVAARASA